ncbi:hypothetical protein C6V83_17965 [Gordonia iterans]|uniref:Recombinase domain-containing protein n=1 Tax=Gordonia iterans TaxID=1004901 RepID=A0A2S0KJK8_9ACTN|nr:recombinase family protein [Gordonia iterans]AVM01864.1 hypothetical protein C6V83_17965 [Gordonia iterans]
MSRAYGWDGGQIVPAEADVIRDLATKTIAGTPTAHLVKDLNERGIPTVTGARWSTPTLGRLLKNPRLIGKRQARDGQLIDNPDAPPILDLDTWNALQAVMRSEDRQRFAPTRHRETLLAGLLRCGRCGGPLYWTGGDAFSCGDTDCKGVRIQQAIAETEITERVLVRLTSTGWLDALSAALHSVDAQRDIIADCDARMVRLAEEFGAGGNPAAFEAGMAAARRRKAEAEAALDAAVVAKAMPSLAPADVVQWWTDATMKDHRAVLNLLIDHVDVAARKPGRTGADRLDIVWKESET